MQKIFADIREAQMEIVTLEITMSVGSPSEAAVIQAIEKELNGTFLFEWRTRRDRSYAGYVVRVIRMQRDLDVIARIQRVPGVLCVQRQ